MAKEKKTAAKPAQKSPATEENVMDDIKEMNTQTEESVAAAIAEIEKERDEKKKREAMNAIKKHEYKNKRALIELRKRRAEDKATKEHLAATKETLDNFLAGKLTAVEADEKDKKDEKTKSDAFREIEKKYSTNIRELRDAYPGYWSYEWDTCW